MRLPDFLIIGAMKTGTTTLYTQLAAQPGIFMSPVKEPNYFSDDDVFSKGPDWYATLFAQAGPNQRVGEASTHYTKLPTYPDTVPRMASALSAPRLIYVIRDPIARTVSQYVHEWSKRELSGDIESAIDRYARLTDYSRYGMQIAPYVDAFGADAIYLTSLERLAANPESELAAIGAHIGAEQPLSWQNDISPQNTSGERWRRLPLQRTLVDNPLAEKLRRTLVPKAVRDRIREARGVTARPELSQTTRARLASVFIEDRDTLSGYFPSHPALTDAYPFAPVFP